MPDSQVLLNYLKSLLSAQFAEVLFRLEIDESLLSSHVGQAQRAIEVIKLLKQSPDGLVRLENVRKGILNLSNLETSSLPDKDTTEISQQKSGVEITCREPELPIDAVNNAYSYYLKGAITKIHCYVNGRRFCELRWEEIKFIPLEIGTHHIKIEYEISDYIILLSTILSPVFRLFLSPASDRARESNYKFGGDAVCHVSISPGNNIEHYRYRPSLESIWKSGKLERINVH